MKKIIIFSLSLLFLVSLVGQRASAQEESTSSASVEEIQKSLQDRIKKALDENLPEAQNTLNQAKNRAVIGLIDSLNQNEITVLVNQGKGDSQHRHQVVYSTNTSLTRSGKVIKPETLSIGEYVISIGSPINESSLQAEKIIVAPVTPVTINTEVVYVTISEVDTKNDVVILTGNHPSLGEFDITAKTSLLTPSQEELELTDLSAGQKAVAVLTINLTKKTTVLSSLVVFPGTSDSPTPKPVTSTCGDNICQNVSCFGVDCPIPESAETCPADCTQ